MVVPRELEAAVVRGDLVEIQCWFAEGDRDPDDEDFLNEWDVYREADGGLLHLAAAEGHCEVIRFLLAKGANVNMGSEVASGTPLHRAATARYGHLEAAVLLLDAGARVNARDDYGMTPLLHAAWDADCDILRLLLSRGASLDARDEEGYDAEGNARRVASFTAARLLADVRAAGGWRAYVRAPRVALAELRACCALNLASAPREDVFLQRLFFIPNTTRTRHQKTAKRTFATALPKEVFWHVLQFWRCDRDARA